MNVPRLRRALLRPWWPTPLRAGAVGGLKATLGPEAQQALLDGLAVRNATVHSLVVLALNEREPPVAVETVVQAARAAHGRPVPDPYRPPDALEVSELDLHFLRRLPLVEIARVGLSSSDLRHRQAAVEVLRSVRDNEVAGMLNRAQADSDATVRSLAAEALAYQAKAFK